MNGRYYVRISSLEPHERKTWLLFDLHRHGCAKNDAAIAEFRDAEDAEKAAAALNAADASAPG